MAKKTSKEAAQNAKSVLAALGNMQSTSKEDMLSDFFGMSEEEKKEINGIDKDEAEREITENREGYDVIDIDLLEPNPLSQFHMRQDESWEAIRDMMQRHGFVKGFLITGVMQDDGRVRIISGHRRCSIAKSIGIKKVPVMLMEITSEAEEIDLVLAANHNRGESITDLLKNYILCGEKYDAGLWNEEERAGFSTKRAFIANKLGYPESKIINHEFLLHYDAKLWILIDEKVFAVNDLRKVYTKERKGEYKNANKVLESIVSDEDLFDRSVPLAERRQKGKAHLAELENTGKRPPKKKQQIRTLIKPLKQAIGKREYSIPTKSEDRKKAANEIRGLIEELAEIEKSILTAEKGADRPADKKEDAK